MSDKISPNNAYSKEWEWFQQNNNLTDSQIEQFKTYYNLLSEWNDKINITRIIELDDVLNYHFADSLVLSNYVDLTKFNSIADVGTGGGFPGIPLKIKYPHLKVTLIEVVGKKVMFLEEVIKQLDLDDIDVLQVDWRTFLRTNKEQIQLFCARASLQILELLRLFRPSTDYQHSSLVYWASNLWIPLSNEEPFVDKEISYAVGDKKRKLIFFKSNLN